MKEIKEENAALRKEIDEMKNIEGKYQMLQFVGVSFLNLCFQICIIQRK